MQMIVIFYLLKCLDNKKFNSTASNSFSCVLDLPKSNMKTKKEKLANFSKKRNRIASKTCGDQHGVDGEREEDV